MFKIFTVFGATGQQGGSVVKHVLAHPELSKTYKVRAITRDTSKPAAIALKEKGCEVVAADLNDKESVFAAIKGSSVVFGVTNYWEKMDGPGEIQQGKNMADACKDTGVDRFIWSSLPAVTKETHGKISVVEHFDTKAEVEAYVRSIGIPASFFMPAMFLSVAMNAMKKTGDGYAYTAPFPPETTKLPLYSPADDTGLFVAATLLLGDETLGKRILGSGPYITPNEIVKQFTEVTGEKAWVNQLTWKQYHDALPPAVADELTGNFELAADPGYYVGEPADGVDKSQELVAKAGLRKPITWAEYVKENFKPQ